MHPRSKASLQGLPPQVLVCLALTPLAWILYLASQIILSGTISLVQLGMAGLCSLVLFGLRGWGRWLCVVYDGLLVAALAYQVGQGQGSALIITQGAAFALAGGVLFYPATIRAFQQPARQPAVEKVSR